MSIPGLDYCFINPNLLDFKADTLRKAIVKLHRLNAACHTSPDDWAQNLLEATKDLRCPEDQEKFYLYLANPSGFEENKELWDALEKWDKHNTDPQIHRDASPDVFDPELFQHDQKVVGNTVYINLKNTSVPTIQYPDEELGTISELEEKSILEDEMEEKMIEVE